MIEFRLLQLSLNDISENCNEKLISTYLLTMTCLIFSRENGTYFDMEQNGNWRPV